jgi:hypothetical protein
MDPRVNTPIAGLTQQFTLSKQLYDDELACVSILDHIRAARARLDQAKDLDQQLTTLEGAPTGGRGGRGAAGGPDTLNSVRAALANLLRLLQGADTAPTAPEVAAVADRHKAFTALEQRWKSLQTHLP